MFITRKILEIAARFADREMSRIASVFLQRSPKPRQRTETLAVATDGRTMIAFRDRHESDRSPVPEGVDPAAPMLIDRDDVKKIAKFPRPACYGHETDADYATRALEISDQHDQGIRKVTLPIGAKETIQLQIGEAGEEEENARFPRFLDVFRQAETTPQRWAVVDAERLGRTLLRLAELSREHGGDDTPFVAIGLPDPAEEHGCEAIVVRYHGDYHEAIALVMPAASDVNSYYKPESLAKSFFSYAAKESATAESEAAPCD